MTSPPAWWTMQNVRQSMRVPIARRSHLDYSQWRVIVATAATRLANARSRPVSSMSSPLISVARQRQIARVLIRARMRDFDLGLVMALTMWHHYHAIVE
jgi:hypothetical protein